MVRRFRHEARAAPALNHSNILTVYEMGESEGRQYIATEYIDGKTLRQRMSGPVMPLREALEIAVQVAFALSAAHSAGVIHRDIKPENIMTRSVCLVKVLDFGLCRRP